MLRKHALLAAERAGDRLLVARVAHALGRLYYLAWQTGLADHYTNQAFALRRVLGDRRGMSAAGYQLGKNALDLLQIERALATQRERVGLERAMGNEAGILDALAGLSDVLRVAEDRVGADAALEEALTVWERLRVREVYTDGVYHLIYNVLLVIGDLERAQVLVDEIVAHTAELPLRAQAQILKMRGGVACARGNLAAAEEVLPLSIARAQASGMAVIVESAQFLLAWALSLRGAFTEAHALLDACRSGAAANGHQCFVACADAVRGRVWLAQGELQPAQAELLPGLRTWARRGLLFDSLVIAEDVGRLFIHQGQTTHGLELLAACGAARRERLGVRLWPVLQPLLDNATAAARQALGEERFSNVWTRGSACVWEDAIAKALQSADIR